MKSQNNSILRALKGQTIDKALGTEGGFTDEIFPPTYESLFSSSQEEDPDTKEPMEVPKFARDKKKQQFTQLGFNKRGVRYNWSKLCDITKVNRLNMIKETRDIKDDIIQGELGDNYYLSILEALTNYRDYVKDLINPEAKPSDTAFETNVYIHGEPVTVIIDDNFPTSGSKKLAFAGISDKSNNIWPIILEKAWAKVNRNYENILEGNSPEALEFLTPAPIETFTHGEVENEILTKKILEGLEKNKMIFADIIPEPGSSIKKLSELGLITNHAYLVIGTAKVKNPNGDDILLLKLKNLLGINEWSGDWSDNSLKWTKQSIEVTKLKRKEDGIFWMSFNDYLQFYTNTHISYLDPNYEYTCQKFRHAGKNGQNVARIEVTKPGSGYFIVNLKSQRIYRKSKNPTYENPFCSMIVFKETNDGIEIIGSDCGKKNRLFVPCEDMTEGKYLIEVSFPKKMPLNEDFIISDEVEENEKKINYRVGVYSNIEDLIIENITPREKNNLKNVMNNLIRNEAENHPEKYYYAIEGEPTSFRTINFDENNLGHGYIYYKNNSDAYLKERLTFLKLKNINIVPILQDGYFVQEEKSKYKKQRNSKESNTRRPRGPQGDSTMESEEVEYESNTINSVMNNLKGTVLKSTYEVVEPNQQEEQQEEQDPNINNTEEKKPLILQLNIAPHSEAIILLKKAGTDIDLDFDMDTCFDYLTNVFFGEQKFPQRKYRLKYNDSPVEIYECITEHNSGVFYQYKNRTQDLRVAVTATFTQYDNLFLNLTSSDIDSEGGIAFKKYKEGKFREDEDGETVNLVINPGETGFFGLSAIDAFEKFKYSCDLGYNFSLAKSQVNNEEKEDMSKRSSISITSNKRGYKKGY